MKLYCKFLLVIMVCCILFACGGGGGNGATVDDGIEIIEYGPATRYLFDETEGTVVYNDYFDDFHGQIVGAQRVVGKSGNALDFSQTNGAHVLFDICCNSDPDTGAGSKWISFPDDSLSIAAWVKLTNMSRDTIYPIFGGWYGSVQSIKVRINNEAIELLLYPENNGEAVSLISSVSPLPTNEWFYFTITYDGSNSILYLNGIEDNNSTIIMPIEDIVNDYFIGGIPTSHSAGGGEHNFPGIIDDFFMSSEVLTPDEINVFMSESE